MTLTFSVPSKTFLVGEYAVLNRGPALVLNTSPRFELVVRRGPYQVTGIPEKSPANQWLELRQPLLESYQLEFKDPHMGQGGLGASGAQFVLVHCLTTFLQSSFARVLDGPAAHDVWNDYQVLSKSVGSGADLLAQMTGEIALVEMEDSTSKPLAWPYPEIGWSIVRTHQKVPTHHHLINIDRSEVTLLKSPAVDCTNAFGRATAEEFIGLLKIFATRLRDVGLQAPSTLSLINLLETQEWCLLAKGCGALGADTVLFLYPVENREKVNQFVRKQSLTVVASLSDLSGGLEVKWN